MGAQGPKKMSKYVDSLGLFCSLYESAWVAPISAELRLTGKVGSIF